VEYEVRSLVVAGDAGVLRLTALCHGPDGAEVWARAWLSNQRGTLAESAQGPVLAGSVVSLEVPIPVDLDPEDKYLAAFRVEASPLDTRDVKVVDLDFGQLAAYQKPSSKIPD